MVGHSLLCGIGAAGRVGTIGSKGLQACKEESDSCGVAFALGSKTLHKVEAFTVGSLYLRLPPRHFFSCIVSAEERPAHDAGNSLGANLLPRKSEFPQHLL